MQHRSVFLLSLLLSSCGWDWGVGFECNSVYGCADEVGGVDCGDTYVVFESGVVILSHQSCTDEVADALTRTSTAVVDYAAPPCPEGEERQKFRCFSDEVDDHNPDNDMWCGYCPSITGVDAPPAPYLGSLCWRDPRAWEPAARDGAIPYWREDGTFECDAFAADGDEPLWPLPLSCPPWLGPEDAGKVSCRSDGWGGGCSCNCVDSYGWSDVFWEWWTAGYPHLPALADYDLPVEPTCSGEPIQIDEQGWPRGSTVELDGFDPPSANGKGKPYTPLWEMLADVPPDAPIPWSLLDHAADHLVELTYGASTVVASDRIEVESCARVPGAACARLGLRAGDAVVGGGLDGNVLVVMIERDGVEIQTRVQIEEPRG